MSELDPSVDPLKEIIKKEEPSIRRLEAEVDLTRLTSLYILVHPGFSSADSKVDLSTGAKSTAANRQYNKIYEKWIDILKRLENAEGAVIISHSTAEQAEFSINNYPRQARNFDRLTKEAGRNIVIIFNPSEEEQQNKNPKTIANTIVQQLNKNGLDVVGDTKLFIFGENAANSLIDIAVSLQSEFLLSSEATIYGDLIWGEQISNLPLNLEIRLTDSKKSKRGPKFKTLPPSVGSIPDEDSPQQKLLLRLKGKLGVALKKLMEEQPSLNSQEIINHLTSKGFNMTDITPDKLVNALYQLRNADKKLKELPGTIHGDRTPPAPANVPLHGSPDQSIEKIKRNEVWKILGRLLFKDDPELVLPNRLLGPLGSAVYILKHNDRNISVPNIITELSKQGFNVKNISVDNFNGAIANLFKKVTDPLHKQMLHSSIGILEQKDDPDQSVRLRLEGALGREIRNILTVYPFANLTVVLKVLEGKGFTNLPKRGYLASQIRSFYEEEQDYA